LFDELCDKKSLANHAPTGKAGANCFPSASVQGTIVPMQDLSALYKEHVGGLQQGYEAAMSLHGLDAIVIGSGKPGLRNPFDDQYWPLAVTPAFAHWLPLMEPDCFLIIRIGRQPQLIRRIADDFWHSPKVPESTHFWNEFKLLEVRDDESDTYFPIHNCAYITRDPDDRTGGAVNPPALVASLDQLRTHKSAYEIACLVEASRRAALGHRAAERAFFDGDQSELMIHLAYLAASEQDDDTTPYKGIVALGAHAAVLHHVVYGTKPLGRTDTSLLIDAGAKYLGYGSDITRTYARGSGAAARQFSSLVTAVDTVQRKLCELMKNGMEYEALHDQSHHLLAYALEEIGLLRGSVTECVDRGVTRALFPHGLGHSLGIVTHDVGCKPRAAKPDNKYLRTTSMVATNNVFTIEPGVYFIDSLLAPLQQDSRSKLVNWPLVEVLKPFGGVRIEDNVQVLADSVRNLTREAFGESASASNSRPLMLPSTTQTSATGRFLRSTTGDISTPPPRTRTAPVVARSSLPPNALPSGRPPRADSEPPKLAPAPVVSGDPDLDEFI
jgi:Xaa-Pro dipeptidase